MAKAKQAAAEGGDAKTIARRWVKQGLLTPWQAGQIVGARTDLHIGKYRLVDQLGEVGLGRVYLAQHVQMDRRVALKLLSRRHSNSESVQRFLAHVRELAGIDHPNIIRAYDVDRHDDRYFLVMEYVAGKTLEKRIHDGGLATIEVAVNYLHQMADALACAHAKGVPHGDLKPANLIIDEEDQVKLLNLGLSSLKDEGGDGDTSRSSEESGGFPFPKHLLGQERVVERFDLFALGATFAFMLTGKKDLGPARDIAATLQRLRPEVPENLAKMCQSLMLCDDKTQPTAEHCAATLAAWQKEHGARIPAPKKREEAAPPKRKAESEEGSAAAVKKPAAAPPRKKPAAAPAPVVPAADEEEHEHEESSGFSIQLNRPPAAPAVAAAGAIAATATAPGSPSGSVPVPAVPSGQNPASPMMMILLLAGFGGVVLLGGIYGVWAFMSSGPAAVAVNDKGEKKEEKKEAASTEDKKGEEKKGESPEKGEPGKTSEKKPEEKKPEEKKPAEKKPEEKKPEEKKPEEKKPEEKKPPEENPVKPETKPEEKKPDPAPEKMPDPPAPAPMPTPPPMPEPKPAEPPAREKALRDFPTEVELPMVVKGMATAPLVLGKVDMKEGDSLVINLLGGEKANGRGKQQFQLAARNNGLSQNEWDFKIVGGAPSAADNGEGTGSIAKLTAAEGELRFEWTPEGLADETSNYLRNCALAIRVGGDERNVPLRKPAEVETFLLMFDKPIIPKKELKKIDFLPDLSLVRLEVLPVEGQPDARIEPKEAPLDNGLIDIKFGKPESELFKLTLESKVVNKRVPTLTLSPYRSVPGALGIGAGTQWVKFVPAQLGKEMQALQQSIAAAGGQANALQKVIAAAPAQQKTILMQQKAQLEYQIEQGEETAKRFGSLQEQLGGIHERGQVFFQLVYIAGESRVVLAKSVPGLNQEKPKRGPNLPKTMPPGGAEGLPGLNLERQN